MNDAPQTDKPPAPARHLIADANAVAKLLNKVEEQLQVGAEMGFANQPVNQALVLGRAPGDLASSSSSSSSSSLMLQKTGSFYTGLGRLASQMHGRVSAAPVSREYSGKVDLRALLELQLEATTAFAHAEDEVARIHAEMEAVDQRQGTAFDNA
eukprot:GHVT01022610.1.p1 GENE.GHVT01022610.1~~GHVT01022610.1.p1  ORF type:complete len:154 (+),score=40.66 GHVT01022610.1:187-648(+)